MAQGDVWAEIDAKADRLGTVSATRAQDDIFEQRDSELEKLRGAFPLAPGQCGAVLALGRDLLCLDYVSRPQAFARLYPKLLDGYLLDAVERLDRKPVESERLDRFVDDLAGARRSRRRSAGLGEDVRLHGDAVIGSGLELDDELLQLCAFSPARTTTALTRVARQGRRR